MCNHILSVSLMALPQYLSVTMQSRAGLNSIASPASSRIHNVSPSSSYCSMLSISKGHDFRSVQNLNSWRNTRRFDALRDYTAGQPTTLRKKRALRRGLSVRALQGAGRPPRRLVDVIRAIPKLSRAYFKSPFRRALYGGISLLGGFYVAQTISLSFGALGVNDVVAAALCVLFAEYVTRFYYTREKVTFTVALLNNFKMGLTYGLFIDAFKLAS